MLHLIVVNLMYPIRCIIFCVRWVKMRASRMKPQILYIKDAQSANKTELVETWQTIKKDRLRHLHMLKEALEKEIHA